MRDKLRWLAVPPALALLLMFGPWRSPAAPPTEPIATTPSASPSASRTAPTLKTSAVPFPDMTQVVCTVLGVCLLGGAIVMALSRVRQRQGNGNGTAISVRQSLKLSNRHAVHVVQFDDKIFLLGECEGSLRVLHSGEDRELVPATAAQFDPDDEGAVLKDMILPRPSRPAGVGSRGNVAAQKKGLADFRTLLSKTRAEA